jgi:hypothetical protein
MIVTRMPGVTVDFEYNMVLRDLTPDFLSWWEGMGGTVSKTVTTLKDGNLTDIPVVWYGVGRKSHRMAGGSSYLIRFRGVDSKMPAMLLLAFDDLVISHNLNEVEKYAY